MKKQLLEKEIVTVQSKKPLKTLFKGVKLPVLRTLLGSLLYVIGTLIVGTQADALANISVGNFTDLSPIITYALMCSIGYVLFYVSVVADLGFVELAARVRKKIWKKSMNLPLTYYDREGTNRVLSRITSDPEYSYQPFKLLQLTFTLLTLFLLVLVGNAAIAELALILIAGFIITMVIMFIAAKFNEKGAMFVAAKLSAFTAFLAERLNRSKCIKAMNSEEKENAAGLKYIDERYEADKYNAMAMTLVQLGQVVLPFILHMAAFLFGAMLISGGKVTSTTALVAFYSYGNNLVLVFQFFAQFPAIFAITRGGSKKVVAIFEEKEEALDQGQTIMPSGGSLRMDGVTFGYKPGQPVVRDVSMVIPEGKVTAIIGENGSGKTTVLRLLDRLYPDFEGRICLGETDSTGVALRAWREKFGIVSQNASLFEGTIRDNITYGMKDAAEEEVQAVIALSGLEDVIAAHEEGLGFNIGPNGEKLSGGEAQRVAIARAMMKNPDVLILDEATANLDPMTERKVRESVEALKRGRTAIVVAHSYSAVAGADNVIVMKNGSVEDQGTPEELLGRNEFFRLFASAAR